ncbi:hypothetical protein XNA1_550058 [Xenorhabdus nematophila str. Anatoliense]|nr:hypothetical protein XNA1_2330058 [Xenorhabdus nematophila str. Anatoliense]CEE95595.1 hypothetical protein XNA1_550058 [Xenorhabdus nematophila str. Anatoliense]
MAFLFLFIILTFPFIREVIFKFNLTYRRVTYLFYEFNLKYWKQYICLRMKMKS